MALPQLHATLEAHFAAIVALFEEAPSESSDTDSDSSDDEGTSPVPPGRLAEVAHFCSFLSISYKSFSKKPQTAPAFNIAVAALPDSSAGLYCMHCRHLSILDLKTNAWVKIFTFRPDETIYLSFLGSDFSYFRLV